MSRLPCPLSVSERLGTVRRLIESEGFSITDRVATAGKLFVAEATISRWGNRAIAHLVGDFEATETAAQLALLPRFELFVERHIGVGP